MYRWEMRLHVSKILVIHAYLGGQIELHDNNPKCRCGPRPDASIPGLIVFDHNDLTESRSSDYR